MALVSMTRLMRVSGVMSRRNEPNDWRVPLALLLATISISFAAIFFVKTKPTDPFVSAGLRLTMAAAVMFPLSLKHFKRLRPSEFASCALAGVCYAVHFGAWVWSLMLTSVAASTTLVTATPLVLALVGWLSGKDRPSRRLWLALSIAVCGISCISMADPGSAESPFVGNALAFLGALGMVGYLLIGRGLTHLHPWVILSVASFVGGSTLLVAAALLGIPLIPPTSDAFFWIVMATLIPQLIGHTALTYALRFASPTAVSMATVAEPAGAALLAWVILSEQLSLTVALGCLLTMGAVTLSSSGASAKQ